MPLSMWSGVACHSAYSVAWRVTTYKHLIFLIVCDSLKNVTCHMDSHETAVRVDFNSCTRNYTIPKLLIIVLCVGHHFYFYICS